MRLRVEKYVGIPQLSSMIFTHEFLRERTEADKNFPKFSQFFVLSPVHVVDHVHISSSFRDRTTSPSPPPSIVDTDRSLFEGDRFRPARLFPIGESVGKVCPFGVRIAFRFGRR